MTSLANKTDKDKDKKEGSSSLQVAGAEGEITAGYLLKKSAKANDWSRRWFVLNEKTRKLGYTKKQEERQFRGIVNLEDCVLEEIDEEDLGKSLKDSKKSNGVEKGRSLMFKLTHKVAYKTVLKAHSALVLKAESMADKAEWIIKLLAIINPKGVGPATFDGPSGPIRQSHSEGSLEHLRKLADPEEELRWMSQEVRGYVEAVLNSLAANIPKAVVLCQVEKAKEDMLNQLYTSISQDRRVNTGGPKCERKKKESPEANLPSSQSSLANSASMTTVPLLLAGLMALQNHRVVQLRAKQRETSGNLHLEMGIANLDPKVVPREVVGTVTHQRMGMQVPDPDPRAVVLPTGFLRPHPSSRAKN